MIIEGRKGAGCSQRMSQCYVKLFHDGEQGKVFQGGRAEWDRYREVGDSRWREEGQARPGSQRAGG